MLTTAKSQADGDDIRIVFWNGGSWVELDRVLDTDTTNFGWDQNDTKIWFKTQGAIGASSSNTNYWLFYGNAAATSPPANPNNVYLFYDGFESGGTGAWDATVTAAGDTIGTAGSPVHAGSFTGRAVVDSTNPGQATVRDEFTATQGFASTMWVQFPAGYSFNADTTLNQFYAGIWGEQQSALAVQGTTREVFIWNNVAGQGYFGASPTVINTGQWYRIEFRHLVSPTVGRVELWVNGALEMTTSNRNTGSVNTDNNLVGIYWKNSGPNTLYFDDVYNRLWVDPEPTVTITGAEQGPGC